MPANMISAPVGSSFAVSGSSIATVSAGPTPGSTPTNVPSVTPMKPHNRLIGLSATPKPASSASNASMRLDSGHAEQRREPSRRQADVQQLDEKHEHREREHEPECCVAHDPRAAEAARDAAEERRSGKHEPAGADQRHVREEARREPAAEQQQAGSDDARNEVRADPRVAAFRRQHRRSGRDARAKREHAERERDFRGRAALHMRYFFRPSDSMIPATRLVSSSRNLPYASPARNTGVQPSFSSVAFHAGVSVAFLTSC